MKRFITLILLILLLAALPLPAGAALVSPYDAAETLSALGLLHGTEKGMELDREVTRAEAAVMVLRLLGLESEARKETAACPFTDGGWAAPQLAFAWNRGLVRGRSSTYFGSAEKADLRDFVTLLLRALGYSETQGDFTWSECLAFADSIDLCRGEYTADSAFLRGDMAQLSYTALTLPVKGSEQTLSELLYREGVLSGAALRTACLPGAPADDRQTYDAVEIHDRCASAVFLVNIYMDEESLQKDKDDMHGSGFFVTPDGVAVMCYHEIDGAEYARITTLDGHRYDVAEVLSYDPLWDTAVVRISKTDLNGESVGAFPYLDLGDSDLIRAGETVYTLSSALGLSDNITDGLISNRSRDVDDPDYRSIQITAPISSGSSGGALLNRFGEVIGILYGAFSRGENMNLAVPINQVKSALLTQSGRTIREVKQIEQTKRYEATLSLTQTDLALRYGEEAEVIVTHTAPTTPVLRYKVDVNGVVSCEWGSYFTKHSVPLRIEAIGDGEAEITISFDEDGYNEEGSVVIHVTVTGTPEDPEEELPSGTTQP